MQRVNIQFLKTMYWGKGTKYLSSKGGVYVEVRFYPWFKFYLPFFQISIDHTLPYPKTKGNNIYNKDKIEPQHIYYNFHVSE